MRKVVLVNQKGGCGKTTTAINVASFLAMKEKRVLLVDLDPQGHAGLGLGVDPDQLGETIYEALLGKIDIGDAIQSLGKNLDALLSNVVLSAFEQCMAGVFEREYKLARSLARLEKKYDYLIIDCPPSVGLLSFNGLLAADEAVIPVDTSPFSLSGLEKLIETINLIEKQTGHLIPYKILAVNIDRRTRYGRLVLQTLNHRYNGRCFNTCINTCTRLREAANFGKSIVAYDRHCIAFRDYDMLTEEILNEESGRLSRPKEEQRILFVVEAPQSATVQVAGDFSNWEPLDLHPVRSRRGSHWQTALMLRPGTYEYKYIVNGRWIADPTNNNAVDNGLGGSNSVIVI